MFFVAWSFISFQRINVIFSCADRDEIFYVDCWCLMIGRFVLWLLDTKWFLLEEWSLRELIMSYLSIIGRTRWLLAWSGRCGWNNRSICLAYYHFQSFLKLILLPSWWMGSAVLGSGNGGNWRILYTGKLFGNIKFFQW